LITAFLFGTTGALIVLSPVGEESGAHINPVVTLAFRLMGKLDLQAAVGYVIAQLRANPRSDGSSATFWVSATTPILRSRPVVPFGLTPC
jgi:Major intrinsic protein